MMMKGNNTMKSKNQMIEEILNKYDGFLSRADLEDFALNLERQDDVSIWEAHTKNVEVNDEAN
jgi:hypothetical protein